MHISRPSVNPIFTNHQVLNLNNGQKVVASCYDKIKFYTEGGFTGVESIETDASQGDDQYYNLMGQKVSPENLGSGIYIHNHKKVMIKK